MCLSLIVRRQLVLRNKDERIPVVTKLVGFQKFRVDGTIKCFIRLCGASNSGRLIWNNRKANAMADGCRTLPPPPLLSFKPLATLKPRWKPMLRHPNVPSRAEPGACDMCWPLPFPANPSLRKV